MTTDKTQNAGVATDSALTSGSAMIMSFVTGQDASLFGGCGRCDATGLIHIEEGNYSTDCPDCQRKINEKRRINENWKKS